MRRYARYKNQYGKYWVTICYVTDSMEFDAGDTHWVRDGRILSGWNAPNETDKRWEKPSHSEKEQHP